jgi:dephospho-CoA kinase
MNDTPSPRKGPFQVALTGNIASGKSAVAELLRAKGATIIDADVLARRAMDPGSPGFDAVVERFGESMLTPDGALDRARLRHRVFNNAAERDALNAIVHPIVAELRELELQDARDRGDALVISDIPLLFEVGLHHAFEAVILVDASETTRLERLIRNRGLTEAEARAMIAAQMPSSQKRPLSTWVIDNDGSRDQLAEQVDQVWSSIRSRIS